MSLSEPKMLLRFAVVGVVNTTVGLATIVLAIRSFELNAYVANALGYAVGLAVGYILNRLWTFRSQLSVARSIPSYVLAFLASYAFNLLILTFLLATTVDPIIAQAAALIGYSLAFYVLCRTMVFPAIRRDPK